MQIVPLQPIPNQTLQVLLGNQSCVLDIQQNPFGVFINVSVGDTLIIGGVICENLNRIVRSAYLGFVGDFVFIDMQGTADPVYTGLGDQFQLVYLDESEVDSFFGGA